MTQYTKKMVGGVAIVFLAGFFTALVAYLVRILLARTLSAESFGLIYAVLAAFGLLSVFQTLGLNEALVKYVSEFLAKNKREEIKFSIVFVVLFQLIGAIAIALVFFFFSDYLAIHYFKDAAAVPIIRLIALSIVFSPLETIFLYSFQAFQKIGYYSLATFSRQAFLLAITFWLLSAGFNVLAYPIAFVAVYVLTFIVYFPIFIKKVFPDFFSIKTRLRKDIAKKLVHFGIPVILTASATIVLSYTDTLMITYFQTLKDVAYYNVAVPTAKVLWIFSTSIATVLLPLSSELWISQKKYLRSGVRLISRISAMLIIPASFAMFVFSKGILNILFGTEYATDSASFALKMLSIGAIFVTLNQANMSVISGIGKPKYNSMTVWSGAILNFGLNLFLIPRWGIEGAATSTMIAFGLMWLISHIRLKKLLKAKEDIWGLLRILACAFAFIAILFLLRETLKIGIWPKMIISLIAAGIVYIGLLFLTRALSVHEVKMLLARVFHKKMLGGFLEGEKE